jgi:hypothetical protein
VAAWIPPGYTPEKYTHDLLLTAFPMAYTGGVDECDIRMFVDRPNGMAELQRYVADKPDAEIPEWMRDKLRAAADGTPAR